jgi:hypothetical protein
MNLADAFSEAKIKVTAFAGRAIPRRGCLTEHWSADDQPAVGGCFFAFAVGHVHDNQSRLEQIFHDLARNHARLVDCQRVPASAIAFVDDH